jgi:hypothetical protein
MTPLCRQWFSDSGSRENGRRTDGVLVEGADTKMTDNVLQKTHDLAAMTRLSITVTY